MKYLSNDTSADDFDIAYGLIFGINLLLFIVQDLILIKIEN